MFERKRVQKNAEFFLGLFSILTSNFACYLFFTQIIPKILEYGSESWIEYYIILSLSYVTVFFSLYSPINFYKRSKPMEISATLRNCLITYSLLSVLLVLTKNEIIQSRYLYISSFFTYCVLSLIGRFIYKKLTLKNFSKSRMATITGIITTTDRAADLIPKLKTDWTKNIKAIALMDVVYENGTYKKIRKQRDKSGVIVSERAEIISAVDGVPVVANRDNVMGWIRTASLDEIFINIPPGYEHVVAQYIEELEDMGIVVNVNVPSLEKILEESKFDNLRCDVKADIPMAIFAPAVHNPSQLALKRVMDFVGGLVGSIISLPIILITAIPLLIESPGPLIFKQQRVGKNGRIFNIYKLRSMYVDAEERKQALMAQNKMDGFMFKMDNDPRITKVGKFIRKTSIDELPQFWNVLKGDMSLVGTRPPTVDEFEKYESHHKRRLSMNPGITGLWQVSGRSNIQNFEEVVKLDCQYIDTWSLWSDIKILFKTVGVVLTHKGAE